MKKISTSQFKSKMRSLQNKYKQEVRRTERKINSQINAYNSAVRKYNSELRRNRTRINNELSKLNSSTSYKGSLYYTTVLKVNTSYEKIVEKYSSSGNEKYNEIIDRIEEENANNLEVANIVVNNEEKNEEYLEGDEISDKLRNISMDLDARWKGAVFSLNPNNPDATRHFCTSTREIVTQLIDNSIDDKSVEEKYPNCEKTNNGNVSRRAKIKYKLHEKGITDEEIEDFIANDAESVLELIYELNGGTHGNAGKYSINQLKAIKNRVEKSINFLCDYIA